MVGDAPPADEAVGEGEEASVDAGAVFPVRGRATELVHPRQGLLDDPAHTMIVVVGAASADQWADSAVSQQIPVAVVVAAVAGDQDLGFAAWLSDSAAHRRGRAAAAGTRRCVGGLRADAPVQRER